MVKGSSLQRAIRMQHPHRRMVVEGQRGQQRPRKRPVDQGQGLETKGLPPQLHTVLDRQPGRQRIQPSDHLLADATDRRPGSHDSVNA